MINLEIPVGKRSRKYRFFEILPAMLSYGAIILLVVLSFVNPLLAAAYLLLVIMTTLTKAVLIAYHTIKGRSNSERAQTIDWKGRLMELEDPMASYEHRAETAASRCGGRVGREDHRSRRVCASEGGASDGRYRRAVPGDEESRGRGIPGAGAEPQRLGAGA